MRHVSWGDGRQDVEGVVSASQRRENRALASRRRASRSIGSRFDTPALSSARGNRFTSRRRATQSPHPAVTESVALKKVSRTTANYSG